QCRDLHDGGAQVDELAAERIDLMARSGDQDAAAVERALRQRVQTIRHLHARTQDQERVAAQTVRRGLAGKLTQRSADAVLARLAGAENQCRWRLWVAAV